MQMELDIVGPAYFCAMKNYVVEEQGKIKIHGSALKSSRFCKIQDTVRDLCISKWFDQKPLEEVLSQAYDLSNYEISDFEFRVRLSRDPEDYSDQTGQGPFLAAQYEAHTGTKAEEDTRIPYVYVKNRLDGSQWDQYYKFGKKKYQLIDTIKSIDEIDIPSYTERIDKMLAKFRITNQIDMFADNDDIKPPDVVMNTVSHDI